ncbi:MAG: hypothetical protein QHJ73_18225, partial [Armatimonadota bacterium]|nr:hypothetical protein [Armatimonadota bacterium]
MNRKQTGILAVLALVLSAGLALADQGAVIEEVAGGKGKVDWTTGKIYVLGRGVPKQGTRGAQARLTARLAARNDALTSWAAVVKEVRVTSESRNVDAALASDEVNVKVEAMVKAGLLVDKKTPEMVALGFDDVGWNPEEGNPNDGEFVVVMVVPLNGTAGLVSHVIPQ